MISKSLAHRKPNSTKQSKHPAQVTEKIYDNGSTYFQDALQDISHAKHSIKIETYIFKHDIIGKKITDALILQARKGVEVKILVDGCGSPFFPSNSKKIKKANVQTKVYHPFPWNFWHWSKSVVKLPLILKWLYLLLMIRRRNHRKIIIIDNRIAYLGSINITDKHLAKKDGGAGWRDTGIRLSGADFSELESAFESCWHHRSITEFFKETIEKIRQDPTFRLNNTRHKRRIHYRNLLKKLRLSTKRIWITNAYFVPENRILKQLKNAAKRGIDVRLIIPRKSDQIIPIPWASAIFYQSLLMAGVRIFEYTTNIIHAKSIIIDDWVLIGSSNLDHLSLNYNLEIDVRLNHEESKQQVYHLFNRDLESSKELTLNNWRVQYGWIKRCIGKFILIFKGFI